VRVDDNRQPMPAEASDFVQPAEVRQPQPAEVAQPQPEFQAQQSDEQDDSDNRDNANMPRRSRRSPRHLRVSGQRRRRYRDERYPTQSAMPLAAAAASPEMASGKVWIRYPVSQASEEQVQNVTHQTPAYSAEETAVATHALPVAAAVESGVQDAPVQHAEPQAETPVPVVNTDDTRAIDAPVDEQPSVVPAADEVKADAVAAEAVPAEPVTEAPVMTPAVETVQPAEVAQSSEVEQPADVTEQSATDVSEEIAAEVEEVLNAPVAAEAETAPVREPHAPVAARDIAPAEPVKATEPAVSLPADASVPAAAAVPNDGTRWKHFASAPMTKAPAPVWQSEPAPHSDWVRAPYEFDGRGSAGAHSATHQATAPATKP
jgi:ribonuclease E